MTISDSMWHKIEMLAGESFPREYFDLIYPCFANKFTDKTVLEIGPFMGWHTVLIENQNPSKITLVEANHTLHDVLKENFPDAEVITDDIFHYLETSKKFDAVVCCGVLYHFHSPLYLLELIANKTNPELIIIESVVTYSHNPDNPNHMIGKIFPKLNENTHGSRQVNSDWKSAGIAMIVNQLTIDYAMNHMGYECECVVDNSKLNANNPSKKSTVMTVWKRR